MGCPGRWQNHHPWKCLTKTGHGTHVNMIMSGLMLDLMISEVFSNLILVSCDYFGGQSDRIASPIQRPQMGTSGYWAPRTREMRKQGPAWTAEGFKQKAEVEFGRFGQWGHMAETRHENKDKLPRNRSVMEPWHTLTVTLEYTKQLLVDVSVCMLDGEQPWHSALPTGKSPMQLTHPFPRTIHTFALLTTPPKHCRTKKIQDLDIGQIKQ